MQYLSFFLYTSIHPAHLEALRHDVRALLDRLGARGRILLASEGINAQMCTPVGTVDEMEKGLKEMHRGIFGDIRFTLGDVCEVKNASVASSIPDAASSLLPFETIDVRIRPRIVTDGLDESTHARMDLRDHGEGLSPAQWHSEMTALARQPAGTRLLDCRNWFESEIGQFEGSTPMGTDLYKQTFEKLDALVEQAKEEVAKSTSSTAQSDTLTLSSPADSVKPPSTFIYCTGGIRCVKVGAYLRSKNYPYPIKFLDGGINAYAKYIDAEAAENPSSPPVSTFKGVNFVFDARVKGGRSRVRLTEDVIGTCHQCGSACDEHVNCENLRCDVLFVQCRQCADKYEHTCSDECHTILRAVQAKQMSFDDLAPHPGQQLYRRRVGLAATVPNPWREEAQKVAPLLGGANATKSTTLSTPWPTVAPGSAPQISRTFHSSSRRLTAKAASPSSPQASTSSSPPLPVPSAAIDAYCIANSTPPPSADLIAKISADTHATMPERANMLSDPLVGSVLRSLALASYGSRTSAWLLELGTFTGYATSWLLDALPAHGTLWTCEKNKDHLDIARAHLASHPRCRDLHFQERPAMECLEELGQNRIKVDFIYLDANKKSYIAYYEYILHHRLLRQHGILVIDNTLWKGLVTADPAEHDSMTRAMAAFNDRLRADKRVIVTMLPIRDGLTIVQLTLRKRRSRRVADPNPEDESQ
jgi:predicted sulfurtransferase/predicted O-methyltransferase YrrM